MNIKVTLTNFIGILLMLTLFVSCGDDNPVNPGDNDDPPPIDTTDNTNQTATLFDTTETANGDPLIRITDRGEGIGTLTLDPAFQYQLENFVFVNEGQELTIPAGTIIKGASGTGENASALIVARGGTIQANGQPDNPIIFTSAADNIATGEKAGSNLNPTSRGLWGGVIILGNAGTNTASNEQQIEGIPVEEERGLYGGTDDTESSGVFRYVSIRHGGSDIGAGNEINGLTMGAVGSGTTIENVEVIANQDDGFEWFGGTVNAKNLVSTENGDDGIDWDQGFRGKNQFIFVYSTGGRGGEQDGGTDPEDGEPFSNPINVNVTSVRGPNQTMTFRDNSGGQYYNSIFFDYPNGVDIEDLDSGEDSRARYDAGEIILENNIFWNVEENNADSVIVTGSNGTVTLNDGDMNISFDIVDPNFDGFFRPDASVTEVNGGTDETALDPFFEDVDYKGAIDPNAAEPFYVGWTLTDLAGVLPEN